MKRNQKNLRFNEVFEISMWYCGPKYEICASYCEKE